jgi:hypothetical protein
MNVTLNDDEVQRLKGLLRDCLPDLKFEAARTDEAELRHILIKRQTLCERFLDELLGASTRM